jgi:hypothetical protein
MTRKTITGFFKTCQMQQVHNRSCAFTSLAL